MNKLIEFINNRTNEKFSHLRFKNAIFFVEKNTILIEFLFRDDVVLSEEDKKEIEIITNEFLENKVAVKLKFSKNYLDEKFLIKNIKQILETNLTSLMVMINLEKTSCEYFKEAARFDVKFYIFTNFTKFNNLTLMMNQLKKELSDKYCYNFNFEILEDEKFNFNDFLQQQEEYEIEEIDGKKLVSKKYLTIFPEPFIDVRQMDLFTKEEKITNEELLNNTFVVFDLETTGLDYSRDKIIEIGAVKIVKGKIIEQFSTLINPMQHIANEATKINGITDQMVSDAPEFSKVVADFYKFCYGSTVVAHNASFDISFLNSASAKLGYFFNNPQQDTLILARSKLKGLKNYKLATISENLGVPLNNAHRSMGDVCATAKIFIKLLENY